MFCLNIILGAGMMIMSIDKYSLNALLLDGASLNDQASGVDL